MITIVTTATISTSAVSVQLGIVVTLMLIALIVQREIAKVGGTRSRTLARLLLVVIAPFLVIFAATVIRHLAALV
jgi:hypothetical protein